jgi:hypothetical protein
LTAIRGRAARNCARQKEFKVCHSERSEESAICLPDKMQIPRFTRDDKLNRNFRDGIASHTQGETKSLPSLDAVPERLGEETKVKRRLVMYTGNLIDELISTVERAEKHAHRTGDSQEAKLPYWYVATERERAFDSKLLGVA